MTRITFTRNNISQYQVLELIYPCSVCCLHLTHCQPPPRYEKTKRLTTTNQSNELQLPLPVHWDAVESAWLMVPLTEFPSEKLNEKVDVPMTAEVMVLVPVREFLSE